MIDKDKETDSKTNDVQSKSWKAYSTIIGGFIFMIFPGSMNCTGVFSTYIGSYYGLPDTKTIV